MGIYVDTAVISAVEQIMAWLPIDGVTTNPTLLRRAAEDGQRLTAMQVLEALLGLNPGSVFMQPVGDSSDALERMALDYIERDPIRVVPKLPMSAAGLMAGRRLKARGARISFTATMSLPQAIYAMSSGADWIIPYYNRLARAGEDPVALVTSIAETINRDQPGSRILVASLKTVAEFIAATEAGAHDFTLTPDLLMALIASPHTDAALDAFSRDWQAFHDLTREA